MLKHIFSKESAFEKFTLDKILLTFFCVIVLRTFLDSFAYTFTNGYILTFEHSLHSLLYFSSIFLSFSILLFLITKADFMDILSFLSKVSAVILFVPIIDLLINRAPIHSLYITPENKNFLAAFFQLMNPLSDLGVTKGIYVSAYITLFLFFIFVYKRTGDLKKATASMALGYFIFYSYSILPTLTFLSNRTANSVLQADFAYLITLKQSWLGKDLSLNTGNLEEVFRSLNMFYELAMARLYWVMVFIQSAIILFLGKRSMWNTLIRNLRMERVVNYSLIAIIGIVINQSLYGSINISNSINILTLACFFLLIALNAWLAVFINDEEDIEIDTISNPERPLIKKIISIEQWRLLYKCIFLIMISGFLLINKQVAFLMILAQCGFYIYSVPPLRLKRHFVFSSLLIGFTTVVIAMSGFFLVSPDQHLLTFPIKAMLIIFISYALLSNIKDVKDFAGDKEAQMKTMPVVFGLRKSKIIIAVLYACVFVSLPFALHLKQLLPFAIISSAFIFYLLAKEVYQEKYIFYTKFFYMIILYILIA